MAKVKRFCYATAKTLAAMGACQHETRRFLRKYPKGLPVSFASVKTLCRFKRGRRQIREFINWAFEWTKTQNGPYWADLYDDLCNTNLTDERVREVVQELRRGVPWKAYTWGEKFPERK